MDSVNLYDSIKDYLYPVLIPAVGGVIAWAKSKTDKLEDTLDEIEDRYQDLEKKVIFVEATYATKAEVAAMLNSINQTLISNNNRLETQIEKLMDLKNAPINMMLEELYRKMEKK